MKKQIYYSIDKFGRIKKDKYSTFINNHEWTLPVVVVLIMLATAWVEGNL